MILEWTYRKSKTSLVERITYDTTNKVVSAPEDMMPLITFFGDGEVVNIWYFGCFEIGNLSQPEVAWGVIEEALSLTLAVDDQFEVLTAPEPLFVPDVPDDVVM